MSRSYLTYQLRDSYIGVLLIALLAGFLVPSLFAPWQAYSTLILQAIFFLTSLRMSLRGVWREFQEWPTLIVVSMFMLVVLPLVVYGLAQTFNPSLAWALFLLAAMPVGMTSPLMAHLFGLNTPLALVLTLVTSLLAPFTFPFLAGLLSNGETINIGHLFLTLLQVIVIPFALAQGVALLAPSVVRLTARLHKGVSLALVGLLIAAIAASYQQAFLTRLLTIEYFLGLAVLTLFFLAVHLAGYWLAWWRNERDRLTIVLCVVYMNFTLAIYIAERFFANPDIVFYTILAIIPWNIGIVLFRHAVVGRT